MVEKQSRTVTITVYRFDPAEDKKPYPRSYAVDLSKCLGVMLLDALEYIKAHLDESLSFRRSCNEGVCGSDGMNINGKNGLACITPMVDMPDNIVLRSLPSFPIVRDLVVDMNQFYKQYERGQPYLQNDDTTPIRERLQSPEDRAKLDGLYECILCACCTSSCPSFWWNPDKFMGPAALLWVCRFLLDSRDSCAKKRLAMLQDAFSLYRCRTIMNCVDSCPKGLNPAKAIADIRHEMLKESV
jgi:succinate dehydrogenase / fumarate reductase, iron-sulfur subunit